MLLQISVPLSQTLATADLWTLYSVPTSQFYCFLSRYSGHRAASWNICTHIKSIFSAFWDCLCLFWSISASSVHQSKFLHLFLLRPSLQSRCRKKARPESVQIFPSAVNLINNWKFQSQVRSSINPFSTDFCCCLVVSPFSKKTTQFSIKLMGYEQQCV